MSNLNLHGQNPNVGSVGPNPRMSNSDSHEPNLANFVSSLGSMLNQSSSHSIDQVIQDVSSEHGIHNSVVSKIVSGEFVCLSEVDRDYPNLLQRLAFQASSGARKASLQRVIPSCAADFASCLQNLSSAIVTYYPYLRSAWNLYTRYLMDLLKIISPAGVFGFDRMHRMTPSGSNQQSPPGAVAPYPINPCEFPAMLSLFLRTQLPPTAMVPLCPICASAICSQTRCNFQLRVSHQPAAPSPTSSSSSSSSSRSRSRARPSDSDGIRVCFNWNDDRSCRSYPCQFEHQCGTCFSTSHRQIACPQRLDASPQRQGGSGSSQSRQHHSSREEKGSPRNNRDGRQGQRRRRSRER